MVSCWPSRRPIAIRIHLRAIHALDSLCLPYSLSQWELFRPFFNGLLGAALALSVNIEHVYWSRVALNTMASGRVRARGLWRRSADQPGRDERSSESAAVVWRLPGRC